MLKISLVNNGWIVQWGYKPANSGLIIFNIAFNNLYYYANIWCQKDKHATSGGYQWYNNKQLTQITSIVTDQLGYWFACGF